VIRSLEIRDLVVIEGAALEPAPGLTVITGETGAGKTVLAQALELLAGGAADARSVRPGAGHALVQATVALPDGFWDRLEDDDPAAPLRELCDDEGEVVVARRVPAEGRARALLDGQAVPREALASLVSAVLRFSGQHQQRRLVGPAAQLAVLDAFAGPEAVVAAERMQALRRRVAAADRAVAAAREKRADADRRRADLEELVRDVDSVAPEVEEEAALRTERDRLRHAERLIAGVAVAAEVLSPDSGEGGAVEAVGVALHSLDALVEVDTTLGAPREELAAAQAAIVEASHVLRGYLDALDVTPGRLDEVEDRLGAYDRLYRRYGGSLDEVLARADAARDALSLLAEGDAEESALRSAHEALVIECRREAGALRTLRAEAAPRLEQAVASELAELAMPKAALRVELGSEPGDPPRDRVTLWLRANPGLPEGALADVASGGELSRVLLALHGVSAAAQPDATWVFDEVDAGIGGVTATAVGAKLAALARGRQVVAITHLPQVAALADRHYRLVKTQGPDGRASTRIEPVEGDELIAELCRMLGAGEDDAGARRHAEELVARRGNLAAPKPARKPRKARVARAS
jgi:DNA repair protein RecN (Recombination protein N)